MELPELLSDGSAVLPAVSGRCITYSKRLLTITQQIQINVLNRKYYMVGFQGFLSVLIKLK